MFISNARRFAVCLGFACALLCEIACYSECAIAQTDSKDAPGGDLSVEQGRLADRYERLEQVITRLAELTAVNDPHRAKLLREALAQARERDVAVRFNAVVGLLGDDRLATASRNQGELTKDLRDMLQLLLKENRGDEIASRKKWLRKQLKEVGRIIRLQRGVKARTEGGDDTDRLADNQKQITGRTGKLGDEIEAAEGASRSASDGQSGEGGKGKPGGSGKGGQGKPGQGSQGQSGQGGESDGGEQSDQDENSEYQNLRRKIRAAQENMQRAQKKLEEAERAGAADEQDKALRELEEAKAELERILRQLREEEMERTLVMLEARFRKMLDMQLQVYEGTQRLDKVPKNQLNHEDEIEAGRLSRRESAIVLVADKALVLLREEGTSVAFPEAVEQMREDMRQIVVRLAQIKVGEVTQAIEEDVIEALEEAIAAIQKALEELEKNRTPPGASPPPGEPRDPQLVDKLAELKMIRSLQARVKRRTERYSKMIDGPQAEQADLISALTRLAERQERIEQATRDLHIGRNQ